MQRGILAAALCAGAVATAASGASARPLTPSTAASAHSSQPAAHSASAQIVYTRQTVVISKGFVRANLIGIAPGGAFKFRADSGPLRRLKVGSVMLLQGSAAGRVTKLQHKGGHLIVITRDAPLTAIVKSGTISFAGRPNVTQAFVAPIDTSGSASAKAVPARFTSPGFPYVADGPIAHTASGKTFSLQGSLSHGFGYSLTAETTGTSSLHISGTMCLLRGDICGNGPASGVSLELSFDGTIDLNQVKGMVAVGGGTINKLKAAFDGIRSNIKVSYTFSRGEGATGDLNFPAIHIPLGIDIPLPGPVPLFTRIQLGLLLNVVSKPAKNTVSYGSTDAQVGGSATITDTDGHPSVSGSGASGSDSVSPGDQGLGISLAPLGLVVATQIKAGLAVGATVANVMGYTDVIDVIGQVHAAAVAGGFCSAYTGLLTWGGGVEAQLGGGAIGIAVGKHWDFKHWSSKYTEPGCTPIP